MTAERLVAAWAQEHPAARPLAEALSLAVHVEPALLRAMRLALRPCPDAGAEADVWFSPLVEAASPSGLTFQAEAARVLRARLAADQAALDAACAVIAEAHAHLPVTIRIQEELIALGLRPQTQAVRQDVTARWAQALRMFETDPGRTPAVARWALRALASAPPGALDDGVAEQVELSARLVVGPPPVGVGTPTPWVVPPGLRKTRLGITVFDGGVELTPAPGADVPTIDVPATSPLVVRVGVPGDDDSASAVVVPPDVPARARMTEVRLWTWDGRRRAGAIGVEGHVVGLAVQRGGFRVAVATADERIHLVRVDGYGGREVIDGMPRTRHMRFAADNESLVVIDESEAVWASTGLRSPWRRIFRPPRRRSSVLDCDGRRAVVLEDDGAVAVYDVETQRAVLVKIVGPALPATLISACLDGDDVHLAWFDGDETVELVRIEDVIETWATRVRVPAGFAPGRAMLQAAERAAVLTQDDRAYVLTPERVMELEVGTGGRHEATGASSTLVATANRPQTLELRTLAGDGWIAERGAARRRRTPEPSGRRRVAILGGGAAGLTAAFEMTATPELRERYEVVVYESSWRLGGRAADGRRAVDGALRSEASTPGLWFGFYENAFDVLRRVYEELDRPPGAPLRTWMDAVHPLNQVGIMESSDDGLGQAVRQLHLPANDGVPGIPSHPPSATQVIRDAIRMLRLVEVPDSKGRLALRGLDKFLDGFLLSLDKMLAAEPGEEDLQGVFESFLRFARPLLNLGKSDDATADTDGPLVAQFLGVLRDVIWSITDGDSYAMMYDLVATVLAGILLDGLDDLLRGGFAQVNDEELSAWLARHGARPETLEASGILRAIYQLGFGYADGDRSQPALAAGKALQAMVRMFVGYKGAFLWQLQRGTGDSFFAPLYEALVARGVRFEFFHEVTDVALSSSGEVVDRITFRQRERPVDRYDPLITDAGGARCWPAEPLRDQLHDEAGDDTLHLSIGADFDDVVLAVPLRVLPTVAGDVRVNDRRFDIMLAQLPVVATHTFQAWLERDAAKLGLSWPGAVIANLRPPIDMFIDRAHLLPAEGWEDSHGVVGIAMLWGMVPGRFGPSSDADAWVLDAAREWLRDHATSVWPAAATAAGGFDWDVLHDPDGLGGERRIFAQSWRAFAGAAELTPQTPPGSIESRLRPSEAQAANLALAGDWTRNGLCLSSIEAAVTSGKLAAQHLTGSPAVVPGTDGWLESD